MSKQSFLFSLCMLPSGRRLLGLIPPHAGNAFSLGNIISFPLFVPRAFSEHMVGQTQQNAQLQISIATLYPLAIDQYFITVSPEVFHFLGMVELDLKDEELSSAVNECSFGFPDLTVQRRVGCAVEEAFCGTLEEITECNAATKHIFNLYKESVSKLKVHNSGLVMPTSQDVAALSRK